MTLIPGISQDRTGLGQPGDVPQLNQVSSGEPRRAELQVSLHDSHRDRDLPVDYADLTDATGQLKIYQEQNDLNSKDKQRDGAIHPSLLTLPTEIISKIFIHCLPECPRSAVTAPLLVTRISHKLREIAFATCQLWSSLRIGYHGNPNISADTHLFFHSWLGRATGQSLSLTYSSFTSAPFTPFAPVIYPLIITYSHQLRSLKLILDTRDVSQFNGIRVSFPILHHLSLHIDLAPADCEVVIFNHLPSLQHLQVLNKGPISNVDIYPSLITLRTDDISIPEFYRVLATCSHLVEFRCRLKGEMNDDPMPITSPRLESLTLSLGDMQGRVLTSLIFPKLQNLSLKGLSALTFENVRHFILQSSRCLESLELFVHNWTGEQMEELLASIPSLEMLKIYPTARNSGPLLKCLISPIILPRLKALSITSTAMFRLRDCRIIISLIKSRHNAGIGLASFKWEHIRAYRYTEDQEASEEQKTLEIANHLQELTKLGFKRSFSSGSVHAVHDSAGEEYCSWDTPLDL